MNAPTFQDLSDGLMSGRFRKAKDIAAQLHVSVRTVFRWADQNKLTRYKVNERVVFFDVSEVRSLIEGGRAE